MGAENSAPKRFKILYPRCFPPQSLRASDGFIKFAQNALHDRPPISRVDGGSATDHLLGGEDLGSWRVRPRRGEGVHENGRRQRILHFSRICKKNWRGRLAMGGKVWAGLAGRLFWAGRPRVGGRPRVNVVSA